MTYKCPVCDYDGLLEPTYYDDVHGSDEICPCCGFQFGLDDYPDKEEGQKIWRRKWIEGGCKWFSDSRKPRHNWELKKEIPPDSK